MGVSPFPSGRERLVCFNVRRLGWYAVSAVVAAIILGSVLLLAANLYVQSQTVQQRIRQALTSTLRMPVTIRKTTVTPWEGLRIDGISARTEGVTHPAEPDFLQAESFRVRFALWPLLQRQLVVDLVWLDKPNLAWAQDPDGRWQFPPNPDAERRHKKPAPAPAPPAPSAISPPPAVATTSPLPEPSSTPPLARPPRRPEGFTVALDKFRLRHGNLDFLNARHRSIGQFEDVNLDGHLSSADHAMGVVTCDKVTLIHPGLALTKVHSDLVFDRNEGLTFNDAGAAFAGGWVAVNCHIGTREPGSPFSLNCDMEKVDLHQLLQQVTKHLELLEGSLRGKISVNGASGQTESRTATGRFELLNARLKDFPLFQTFGDALHIADLSHMQFKVAQVDCRLDGTTLAIAPLLLVSNDLKITGQGHYLTDVDHLDLHARLVVDEAVSRQLPDFIGEQFKPAEDEAPGSRFIDFDVTGPLSNPKSNLYNRLLGDPVKGLLHDMFAPKTKNKDKTPKHRPDTLSPTPSPSQPALVDPGAASPTPTNDQ